MLEFTILGAGNSSGVPAAGNHWGDCDPHEPRNRRTRASLWVKSETTSIVIDTGPDFREQSSRENIKNIDAVFYTHAHGDHCNGMDDLRGYRYRSGRLVPVYGSAQTLQEIHDRFPYIFDGGESKDLYPPLVEAYELKTMGQAVQIGDIHIIPYDMDHATVIATGYRIGPVGYSVDMWKLDDSAVDTLKGIDVWIVDAAGYLDTKNKVHANFEVIAALNERIGAGRVILSCLTLGMDYEKTQNHLPPGFELAYDGMKVVG